MLFDLKNRAQWATMRKPQGALSRLTAQDEPEGEGG